MTTPSLFPEPDPSLCAFCEAPWDAVALRPLHPLGPIVRTCAEHRERAGACRHVKGPGEACSSVAQGQEVLL